MTDRPAPFQPPMVCALLERRKTQTRRLAALPEPSAPIIEMVPVTTRSDGRRVYEMKDADGRYVTIRAGKHTITPQFSPRFAVGDRLWVGEGLKRAETDQGVAYKTYAADGVTLWPNGEGWDWKVKVLPGRYCPKWASRLTLHVTDVRVQRLHEIDDADATAEGVVRVTDYDFRVPGVEHTNKDFPYLARPTAREMYAALWDTIHGSGEWLANPWVVTTTFAVENVNIANARAAA